MNAPPEILPPSADTARWSTIAGGGQTERHHLVEGWLFGEESALPAEIATAESLLFVASLAGEIEWRQGGGVTALPAGGIAGFLGAADIRLHRRRKEAVHLLVWRFQRGTLRASMQALGLPPPRETLCWPIAPRPLGADLQALLLELRSSQANGTARSWWYGAKLLELTALLHPLDRGPIPAVHPGMREPVRRALVFMQHSFAEPISLPDIARIAGLSPAHLSRSFSEETGVSVRHYLRRLRMDRAAQLLRSGECNVVEAAMAVGYASIGQFSQTFRELMGEAPGALIPRSHRKAQ